MCAFHLARNVYANILKVHIKSASANPAHVCAAHQEMDHFQKQNDNYKKFVRFILL